jgi:hypothetical protein
MQNPVEVLAQARIRAGRSGCAASEDLHESYTALGKPRLRDHQAEPRTLFFPTRPLCSAEEPRNSSELR